jgi:hypothetical protein
VSYSKEQLRRALKDMTVKKSWEVLSEKIFTDEHGELQREEMRKMFYAAWHDVLMTMMELTDIFNEDEAAAMLSRFEKETREEAKWLRKHALPPLYPPDVN